jgi:hypothetical protein
MQNNLEQARNLKFVLCLFEQMSGLKLNLHKSEIYRLGQVKESQSKELPMKYLGIPIDKKRIRNSEWNGPIGKIEKKLGSGIGKHMSIAGKTIRINSSITSLTLYMLSFYRLPVGVGKKFNTLSSNFLWGISLQKRNIIWWVGRTFACLKTKAVWGSLIWT